MGTLYWSILILALGGCIGSFLNVVIYRWPLGLSVQKPTRSFCPHCREQIAWYDNLPVLSYLLLRGRCRRCGIRISLQYPIVELATALVFLMTYDAFFNVRLRLGVEDPSADWPILLGHWILFAGLIVLTVMDLEAYMVDIRVTWLVSAAGILCHALWTPASSQLWIRPGPLQAAWAMAAAIGLGVGGWLMLRRQPLAPVEEPAAIDAEPPPGEAPTEVPAVRTWRWLWLIIPVGLAAAYLATMIHTGPAGNPVRMVESIDGFLEPQAQFQAAGSIRVALGLAFLFILLTGGASHPREEADAQIVHEIESEAVDARRMALSELMLIAPAIVLSILVLVAIPPTDHGRFARLLNWSAAGAWQPVWGLSTGLVGWIIGGAIGWLARIGFTILFGKEALGMGDVHILAAAGAVAGWPVALFGFFIAALLALLGQIVIRLRRQSRMIPYGPWLGLGFFLAAMFQDTIFEYLKVRSLFAPWPG